MENWDITNVIKGQRERQLNLRENWNFCSGGVREFWTFEEREVEEAL